MAKRSAKQLELTFRCWGGARKGAGRKPARRGQRRARHRRRPKLTRRNPVHVTLKVGRDIGNLRAKKRRQVIRRAFAEAGRCVDARIVDWSIQKNHLHLVVEADATRALSRLMQGFGIRVAKGLNRLLGRTGSVFVERYHARVLQTPAEIRNARAYVLNNYRRHAATRGHVIASGWVDPCSSWVWFDGWRDLDAEHRAIARKARAGPPLAMPARGYLLRTGWRRRGLVRVDEVPGRRR